MENNIYKCFLGNFLLFITLIAFAQQEQGVASCQYYVVPKVWILNKQTHPLKALSIGLKLDGTDQATFRWKGHLASNQSTLVELEPVPLYEGLHTLSIYAVDLYSSQLALQLAKDEEEADQELIASLSATPADPASVDDCNCMKSAGKGQPQVNLWLYLTETGPDQQSLTGSIDQGHTWVKGVEVTPEQTCSPIHLLFDQEKVEPVEVLVTTDPNARAEEGLAESITPLLAYPNTFNTQTTLQYTLEEANWAEVAIYNQIGQRVAVLVNEAYLEKGTYRVDFKPGGLSTGLYVARLTLGKEKHAINLIYQ